MFSFLLILAAAANPQQPSPTTGLLTIENLDCVSQKISNDQAQAYYAMARNGKEVDAFQSAKLITEGCKVEHGWTDIQTRSAFRVSLMDGWLLQEGLVEKIQDLGDFKPYSGSILPR